MDRVQILLKKYEILVSEWNKISEVVAIYFSAGIIGLAFGLIFNSWITFIVMAVIMAIFAAFEYRTRTKYVKSKALLEAELFRLAKLKPLEIEEIVRAGFFW